MRTSLSALLMAALMLLVSACNSQQPKPQQAAAGASDYITDATVKDIMDSMVDPSADYVWDSVATIVSAAGIEERAPKTDDQWKDVRRRAVTLAEATNLLLIPGRKIAKPGEKADDPKVELAPERIEASVAGDRAKWVMFAHALHDATMAAMAAIDAKNPEDLLNTGDGIDKACENCHLQYWYPDDAARQNALETGISPQKK